MYKISDISDLLNHESTQKLIQLYDVYHSDPVFLDSLLVILEMLLQELPPRKAYEIRRFIFNSFETEEVIN